MGFCVCGGAMLSCPFGMTPSVLNVLPENRTVTSMPIATIMDNKPMVNVMPFGMCKSLANPTVAAATAAAALHSGHDRALGTRFSDSDDRRQARA